MEKEKRRVTRGKVTQGMIRCDGERRKLDGKIESDSARKE